MSGMGVSLDIATSFAHRMPENNVAKVLTGDLGAIMSALDFTTPFHRQMLEQKAMWNGIAGSLNHLVAAKSITEDLAQKALLGQLGLHSSLLALAAQYKRQTHNPFSALEVAFHGLTDRTFKQLTVDQTSEEVEEVNEVVDSIGVIAAEHAKLDRPVTLDDLENLKADWLAGLVQMLSRSKTAHAVEFIMALMHFIGFALQVHATYMAHSDLTNREALEQTKLYVDSLVQGVLNAPMSARDFQWNTRIANHNVNLRPAMSTGSEVLDVIKKGELVVVIAVKKKWLYVSYIDGDTGEPRSGYAQKKYFNQE